MDNADIHGKIRNPEDDAVVHRADLHLALNHLNRNQTDDRKDSVPFEPCGAHCINIGGMPWG